MRRAGNLKHLFSGLLAGLLLACCGCSAAGSAALPASSTADASTEAPASSADSASVPADWAPSGPVTLIVAYKEGSSTDRGARLLAPYLEAQIGQKVSIRNIPADSGRAGWEALAQAAPDGATLGFVNLPNIFAAIENGGNFTMQDFAPVCTHVVETSAVVVRANAPYQTLEDLLEANRAASAAGAPMRAATNGVQASNDIGAALLAYVSGGWNFRHVSYGSTSDQLHALLDGDCDWTVAKISDVLPLMDDQGAAQPDAAEGADAAPTVAPSPAALAAAQAGREDEAVQGTDGPAKTAAASPTPAPQPDSKVRVLALFDTTRDAALPEVPCMTELGYPTGWYGSTRAIEAPARTDPIILQYYAKAFALAMADPACIAAHKAQGLALSYMNPDQLANRIDERERFNRSLLPKLFAR